MTADSKSFYSAPWLAAMRAARRTGKTATQAAMLEWLIRCPGDLGLEAAVWNATRLGLWSWQQQLAVASDMFMFGSVLFDADTLEHVPHSRVAATDAKALGAFYACVRAGQKR